MEQIDSLKFQSPICRVKTETGEFIEAGGSMFQSPICRVKTENALPEVR